MAIIIISAVWLAGFLLSYTMQRTEIAAEKQPYTVGNRAVNFTTSLFSFLWVLVILVTAWLKTISATGYWSQPVTKDAVVIPVEELAKVVQSDTRITKENLSRKTGT